MKHIVFAAVLLAGTASIQAADLGVAISIGQPGFYGRIELGDYPPPQLVYQQPRVIRGRHFGGEPIYLHVPPGHERNWSRHCREYNACGESVYFVQNGWYNREYVPRYQEQHGRGRDDWRGPERDRPRHDRGPDGGHGRR